MESTTEAAKPAALAERPALPDSTSTAAFTLWGYDDRNQVTSSNRYLGTNVVDVSQPVNAEQRAYQSDAIGNRVTSMTAGVQISYVANKLQQYSQVGLAEPSYDEDGNLLDDGKKTLAYNAENQLKSVPVPGISMSRYDYDYLGRRVKKTVHVLNGSASDYTIDLSQTMQARAETAG